MTTLGVFYLDVKTRKHKQTGGMMRFKNIVPAKHIKLIAAVSLLSGCSVATYEEPIRDLDTAVETTVSTLTALDQRMTAARNARWRVGIIDGSILLIEPDEACTQGSSKCSLSIDVGQGNPRLYPATTVIPKGHAGLALLQSYVQNLNAIVTADTADKVAASANRALGSLQNIEAAVASTENGSEGRIKTFSEPVGSLINWVVGLYVDTVKFKALAWATAEAQPIINKLEDFNSTLGLAAADYEIGEASKIFIAAQAAFDEASESGNLTAESVDTYVEAAQVFDVALKASAADPLRAFAEAHRKLTQQLNGDGKVTLADAFAAIENLKTRADEFKAILDQFKSAANDNAGGNDGNS